MSLSTITAQSQTLSQTALLAPSRPVLWSEGCSPKGFMASPKWAGMRISVQKNKIWTRNNNEITRQSVVDYELPNNVDGELMADNRVILYDCFPLYKEESFISRFRRLIETVDNKYDITNDSSGLLKTKNPGVFVSKHWCVNGQKDLMNLLNKFCFGDCEGLVLRPKNGAYYDTIYKIKHSIF